MDIETVNKTNSNITNPNQAFTEQQNTHTTVFTENTYSDSDKATYFKVVMEKDNINELTIGQLLIKYDYKSVVDIKKTNRNRLTVSFKNKVDANNVIKNVTISKINIIKSYIPNSFVKCVGIVKDVPIDLSTEEILSSYQIQGNIKIINITRMNYFDKLTNTSKIGRNLKIEFRATELPMILFYVKKTVEPFIPRPTICRKCLRYGHIAKICRSTTTICINCTQVLEHEYIAQIAIVHIAVSYAQKPANIA